MRVPVNQLKLGMVVEYDIYAATNPFVPLIRGNTVLNDPLLTRLHRHGVDEIYIKDDPRSLIIPQAEFCVAPPPPIIDEELREEALESLEELFTAVTLLEEDVHESSMQIIKNLDTVVERLVDCLEKDRGTLININDLKSFDEYTYHHSLSVAVLSIALAQHQGFDEKALNQLGRCAIMHDIGKTAVPIEVIQKPARLSDAEFSLIKTHSPAGFEYLRDQGIGNDAMWQGVLSHHEKFDGTGYPYGLKGNRIPVMSRIIAVADVYDALTSNRPYREPMQPAEALEYIMGNVSTAFDYDMVDSFVKKVMLYPVGSFVELSDRRRAVVVDCYNHLRPVVQLIPDGEIVDLFHDRRFLTQVITRVVPEVEIYSNAGMER